MKIRKLVALLKDMPQEAEISVQVGGAVSGEFVVHEEDLFGDNIMLIFSEKTGEKQDGS